MFSHTNVHIIACGCISIGRILRNYMTSSGRKYFFHLGECFFLTPTFHLGELSYR